VSADRRYVLTLSCPDTTGIVARIAGFLADAGGWIVEAGYHSDVDSGWFFTRQVVRADSLPFDVDELRRRFGEVAAELGGCDRSGHDASTPHSVRGGRPTPDHDRPGAVRGISC
jgi:formyltetrahydrofolate hydrolase